MALHLTPQQRFRIVELARLHYSIRQIATLIPCAVGTVHSILQRYAQTGDVQERQGRGRPRLLQGRVANRLSNLITHNRRASAATLALELQRHTGQRVSRRTVSRARRQLGFHPVHSQPIPELAPHHIAARLAYAQNHAADTWHYTMFSDEVMFTLGEDLRVSWIRQGEDRPHIETTQHQARVRVWGAIWWSGQSTIHTTSHTFTAAHYQHTLAQHLLTSMPRSNRYRLLQDNAPAHTAAATQQWLANNNITLVPNYPARSPDFNAIEHVWAWMKDYVQARQPQNRQQLKQLIRSAWAAIPVLHRHNYISHIETVTQRCINVNGAYTE
jgi:transposase